MPRKSVRGGVIKTLSSDIEVWMDREVNWCIKANYV